MTPWGAKTCHWTNDGFFFNWSLFVNKRRWQKNRRAAGYKIVFYKKNKIKYCNWLHFFGLGENPVPQESTRGINQGWAAVNVAGGCPDPASKLTWIWIHRNPNPELKLMMIQNYGSNGISKENYKDSNLCCPQHSNPGWWQHDNYPEPVLKSGPEILYKKWKTGPQFKSGSEKIRQSSSKRIRKSARGINQGWAAVNLAGGCPKYPDLAPKIHMDLEL